MGSYLLDSIRPCSSVDARRHQVRYRVVAEIRDQRSIWRDLAGASGKALAFSRPLSPPHQSVRSLCVQHLVVLPLGSLVEPGLSLDYKGSTRRASRRILGLHDLSHVQHRSAVLNDGRPPVHATCFATSSASLHGGIQQGLSSRWMHPRRLPPATLFQPCIRDLSLHFLSSTRSTVE